MKTYLQCLLLVPLLCLGIAPDLAGADGEKIQVLIIDGQNNHNMWPKTTIMMKDYLEATGRFTVDIERTKFTWQGKLASEFPLKDGQQRQDLAEPKTDPDFGPDFSSYDVVISNFGWKAAPWSKATQTAFEEYMESGGGLVVVHAADNSFPEWAEYNKMIGLGGWGGRNEASGPYVYFSNALERIEDTSAGKGGAHGPKHEYQIVIREAEHPITRGLPQTWLHSTDELYQQLRGPAANLTVLATAYADPGKGGTDRHEPMLMTITYGEGRVFHTTMGHDDVSFECVGFITTLLRGTEWAATGDVTLDEVPADFPSPDTVSRRTYSAK